MDYINQNNFENIEVDVFKTSNIGFFNKEQTWTVLVKKSKISDGFWRQLPFTADDLTVALNEIFFQKDYHFNCRSCQQNNTCLMSKIVLKPQKVVDEKPGCSSHYPRTFKNTCSAN